MSEVEKYEKWGLHFNKPNFEQVNLPSDITAVSSEDLGELFTRLTAWADFINSQLAMAQLEERAALKKKDFTENTMLIRRMGSQAKGERITAIKAEVSIDPIIVELDNDYEAKYATRKLTEMLLTNHERDLQLVSREISRRGNNRRDSL